MVMNSRIEIERALRDQYAGRLYRMDPDTREAVIDDAWELWQDGARDLDEIWQAVGEPPEREYDIEDYWARYGQREQSRIA